MGTPEFAVKPLEKLAENFEVVLAVTNEDKSSGRGKKITMPPVKIAALERNIDVFQPKNVNSDESIEYLKSFDADLVIVCAYGKILREGILNLTGENPVNIHASILPKLRGAAPINFAIINGDKEAGVSIMKVEEGLDTGDFSLVGETDIGSKTVEELEEELSEMGADLIVEFVNRFMEGNLNWTKQNDEESTYAPKISKDFGYLDFKTMDKNYIERLSRGLTKKSGISILYEGNRIKLDEIEVADGKGKPGEVLESEKFLEIATKDGSVKAHRLQWPGKKMMDAEDFFRGRKIEKGSIIGG